MTFVTGLEGVLRNNGIIRWNQKCPTSCVLWKCCSEFLENFLKIFTTPILKETVPRYVPYFIKEHLWMSAFDKETLKILVEVNPPQSWPWKQNSAAVVAAVMILELLNNWRRVPQINILLRKLDFGP